MLASVGLAAPRGGGAQPARATSAAPAREGSAPAPGIPLLGSLSFTASREPIEVSADALEYDYRSRVLTYKGNVVVTQGDMKLETDKLTVTVDEHADRRVKEIVADGHVRLSKGDRWATAGHAVFDETQHTVVLSRNAELHDGSSQVSGDRVVVYLDQERSVIEGGGGRVKAVLFPPSPATPATPAEAP
ncbi:MAG: lipopolysaccharide transport periplasmic protein LptA [Candidatus Binatia bacterium]